MGSISVDPQISLRDGQMPPHAAIQDLKSAVKCEVLIKGEVSEEIYKTAIDRFNKAGVVEARVIVLCESEADISKTLGFVQKWGIDMAISCGRHSYYGASSTTGLVIDLRRMKKVSIDLEAQSITAGGGCQAVDLETPLQAQGYSAVMGAANDTGIGGITLGGGTGYLSGQYGMVIDNLIAAKVVIADGNVLQCSEKVNSDLFWAIRGGGSNFGIVSEFTYKIHKQGPVYFGPLIFTPDKTKAFIALLPQMSATITSTKGKLDIFAIFGKGPGMPAVHPICLVFYDGSEEEAKKLIAPLLELGPVVALAAMQDLADCTKPSDMTVGPLTHQHYSTSNATLYDPLDLDILEAAVADLDAFHIEFGAAVAPAKMMLEIRTDGKTTAVQKDPSATAFRARAAGFTFIVEAQHDGSNPAAVMRAAVKKIVEKIKTNVWARHPDKGRFSNANLGDGMEKISDMYGDNLPRLRELKRKYDPNCVFNKWYPIPPAEA